MADACGNTSLNPNVPCEQLDGQYKKPFLHTDNGIFADQDAAKLKANWDTLIQSGDIIPLPNLFSTESQNSGSAYDSSPLGDITVSNGTVSFMFNIPANNELYKKIASFSGRSDLSISFGTATGKSKMYKNPETGAYGGFEIGLFNVENPTLNDGAAAEKAPIKITLEDISQYRNNAVVFTPSFTINRLKALSDVSIEVLSASSTEITFKVNKYSDNDDIKAANPVYGLVEADFTLLNGSGAAQTIGGFSGGTVGTSGVYTITGAGLVTGTLNLVDPSLMTTTGYSSVGAATVTVV